MAKPSPNYLCFFSTGAHLASDGVPIAIQQSRHILKAVNQPNPSIGFATGAHLVFVPWFPSCRESNIAWYCCPPQIYTLRCITCAF